MKELTINNWTLAQPEEGGEPLIQDLDLAIRLGYARPVNIRSLIRRMEEAGQLVAVYHTAKQTSTKGGRPSEEYHLTETQALKVIARSKTDAADKILDEIIQVYQAWRRGQLPSHTPPVVNQDLAELRGLVGQLAGAVASLVTLVGSTMATAPAPLPVIDTPRGLPVPSRALPVQRDLLPARQWEWYSVRSLCEQWGLEVGELWRQFGAAGGRRFVHARQSARGYQVREDVVRKIQIQLEGV